MTCGLEHSVIFVFLAQICSLATLSAFFGGRGKTEPKMLRLVIKFV